MGFKVLVFRVQGLVCFLVFLNLRVWGLRFRLLGLGYVALDFLGFSAWDLGF